LKTRNFFLLIFILLNFNKTFSNKKETFLKKVSFLLFQESDSLKYEKIEKLFKDGQDEKCLINALELLKHNINEETKYKTTFLISEIFKINNNHTKSISYLKKALKILKEDNNNLDSKYYQTTDLYLSKTYLNLGNEYLRLGKQDSSIYFYNKTLEIKSLDKEFISYRAKALSNLSGVFMQDSLYDKAKEYVLEAITIHRTLNNKISEAAALGNLASIYLGVNDFDKAKKTYNEALNLIKFENSDKALRIRERLYLNLAYNLYILKDYEAYRYQELSYDLKDTLRDKEIRRMIEELDFKYNFESQKERFQKQEELKLLKEKDKARTIVLIGLVIFTILLVLSVYFYLRRKNLALKLKQTELLQNQKIEKLKSESQVRILNATIDGKESERKQIAETLHDSVSALLSSANLHLQATRKQFNGSTPVEIDKTQEIILEASHKIRDLSHTLVSSVLLKFGLKFAIKELAEKYSNSVLNIDTNIKNTRRYEQNFEIKVYNITQEFANNILKHSNASNALIELKEENEKLYITISDDGVGFDKNSINIKDGLGINQIDARIQMMKGEFNIQSSLNNGTRISIILPIVEKVAFNHV
tara:strand:- start:1127 stop:2896 length:1770 start_codon:yes stop_codon:yes gene_type:complete